MAVGLIFDLTCGDLIQPSSANAVYKHMADAPHTAHGGERFCLENVLRRGINKVHLAL